MNKRLTLNHRNYIWGGLFGGLGEYFNIDASILRILFIILLFTINSFLLVIIYFICCLIVPSENE